MSIRGIHTFPPSGGGGGPSVPAPIKTFTKDFAVPDTTWSVSHPLGTLSPMVAIYDLTGHMLGDADVYVPDNNTVIVSFAVPVAGRVVLQA